ncbi:DUF1642 domain-containing protein [Pediococcus pentosaceus]|uniref:DUF1642 domain-containing protein n=1 Tax=Pediococcus pentosaceus TaxID=1255 RepID=UPI001962FF84|nr:DUF1642 domain-containing protein [Pediococcus pentosaceus]MBM9929308.1 DUF1642 domain-containing protein [Pediococcus pentosaceus]
MTKDELLKQLKKAIGLAEKLDEPKKVVIPQFVADWIEEAAQPSNIATISVMYRDVIRYGKHIDWFKNHDNQRLLLKALLYGYEVEKEPEFYVKLKGLVIGSAYLNYNIPFKTFSTNSLSSPKHMNTEFTKSWLAKNWSEYDAYNNAGLLEFEKVEDE